MSTAAPTQGRSADLPTRFIAGVVMIAAAILGLWLEGWPFRVFVAAAAAVMLLEWGNMHQVARRWSVLGAGLLFVGLLAGSAWLFPPDGADWVLDEATGDLIAVFDGQTLSPNWIGIAALAIGALAVGLVSRRLAMIGGILYVGVPSLFLISLGWVWMVLVLWVFVVTWATDILAYFAGRFIGGPKLAPSISPKKTWAGLLGGMAGAGLFGLLIAWWFEMEPLFFWLGAPMGAVAQIGDLFESWVKRRCDVKDSSHLIPGHGGVLDRLDGLLAVALVFTLLLMAGLWTA